MRAPLLLSIARGHLMEDLAKTGCKILAKDLRWQSINSRTLTVFSLYDIPINVLQAWDVSNHLNGKLSRRVADRIGLQGNLRVCD